MNSAALTALPPGAFSVLIPAYKAAGYIGPTLAAVAAQRHAPSEVLIFEDGRFDDLAARVNAFAATAPFPVRLLGVEKNAGVSRARNTLMREARGEFIAFLDADDLWAPDHLATAAACFAAGADVAFSGVTFIDATGAIMPGAAEPSAADLAAIAPAMFRYNFVQCTSTLSLRRSWLARVGDFDPTLSHGEDLDLWLRLLAAGAVWRYTGRTSCAYRKHPSSAMGQTRLAAARLTAFYEKQLHNPQIPEGERRGALLENLRINARFTWRDEPTAAAAALYRLFQLQPWNLVALAGSLLASGRGVFVARRNP
jgi:glycosyltransferase involved in cell wall biosynthesis